MALQSAVISMQIVITVMMPPVGGSVITIETVTCFHSSEEVTAWGTLSTFGQVSCQFVPIERAALTTVAS